MEVSTIILIINYVHFLFAGKDCQNLMDHFDKLCARICVSFADEQKKGPTKKLH
jgi:hypothetical protein